MWECGDRTSDNGNRQSHDAAIEMTRRKVPTDEMLRSLYIDQKLSASEIARRHHVGRGNVGKTLKKAGIPIRRCVGPDHHMWKGGRVKLPQGVNRGKTKVNRQSYWGVWMPGHHRSNKMGYVKEHILVMEKKLGRPLRDNEQVHHINFNGLDNAPDNLALFQTSRDHLLAQLSVQRLVPSLLDRGIIKFDGQGYSEVLDPQMEVWFKRKQEEFDDEIAHGNI